MHQINVGPHSIRHFTNGRRQSSSTTIGEGRAQRIRPVEQLRQHVSHQFLHDGITDLHRGTSHRAGGGVHGHGGERGAPDAVTARGSADDHHPVTGMGTRERGCPLMHPPYTAAEHQRVGREPDVEQDGAGHSGHSHLVAVIGHSGHHPFSHPSR